MSALEEIIAHGNRGHRRVDNNHITCADGSTLSVIAGGGTYCHPTPPFCSCQYLPLGDADPRLRRPWEVAHDYPGPYTKVEVMPGACVGKPPKWWRKAAGDVASVDVEKVRRFVAEHGGES